ncbi:MAG: zinc-binding dehydrogenase [Deltaproteobacteria bacterium]|nr:zinc-binding dehydrogenase [Deltaproteobacteria bacterium]
MKAVYINEHGGIDRLIHGDLPDPVPNDHEVLVRVKACGVNYIDLWVRRGLPFLKIDYPFVLGQEVVGEVAAVGSSSCAIPVGGRVILHIGVSCGHCELCLSGRDHQCSGYQLLGKNIPGGYAELVKVPEANISPLPESISYEEAAGLPTSFTTAWNMIFRTAKLQPGEWVLIHAGGSGIGSAAIQLARLTGAKVITTAGSEEKLEKASALGAEYLINYRKQDFLREVRRITKKRGVDVVIEHIGEEVWERSLLCLATGGRLVTCGATSGSQITMDLKHVFFRHLSILGATSATKDVLLKIVRLLEERKLQPVVGRTMPLSDAREAHRLLEERQQFGKVVLVPE